LLGVRGAIAGEVRPELPDRVRALVTYTQGAFVPDTDYRLERTAWRELLEHGVLHVERDGRQRYPEDVWLASLGGDSVLGVALIVDGQTVGLLAVFQDTPIADTATTRGVLTIFARGVAAELSRLRQEQSERARSNAALSHRSALLELAQMDKSELHPALRTIVQTDAITLGAERVSYWALSEDRSEIVCEELYQHSAGTFTRGAVLRATDFPSYFAALLSTEAIVANDARSDPRTCEFTDVYFTPHGITSMLDIPVWRHGRLAGVLCHEQVGPMRIWRDEESDFAISVAGLCSLALEASERHRAEERYELITRATNDVLWDWDLETNQLTWNARLQGMFRYAPEQIEASIAWWKSKIHPDDRASVETSLTAALRGTATAWEFEYRFIMGDATVAWVVDRGLIVRDATGLATRMLGAMVDVTERKAIEGRMLLADRMASLGTLAAGVAHEINNPLAYILANLDFALAELRASTAPEITRSLEDAREGAIRVRTIVHDLRAFSRSDEEVRGPVDLPRIIESSINMAWNEIRHRARLVKDFGATVPVHANDARLGQVVLNLLVNAAQAIPEGAVEDNEIRIVTRTDERGRAVIEVRDTGPGIPQQLRARVFDPFFTTKPIGLGTGLGLSICHSIVAGLGGEITIDDAPGRGCMVRVCLPPAAPPAEATLAPPVAAQPASTRRPLLVIDDDVRVATAARRLLQREWDVVVVTTAREALALVTGGRQFAAVLCDLMMPEMTGMDLHAELVRVSPAVADRMVFMTGGTFTERAQTFLARVANPRIEKPFDRAMLTTAMLAAADRPEGSPLKRGG
ncbi:MAG: GAF domain-containing protein, partial [Deltaproteobacteria bacterium]|nr:GAF domain-containing protein [Deltaproteobacteria bacterium]